MRELLAESCVLAAVAGGLALALAYAGTRALVVLGGIELPGFVTLKLDPTVVAVSVLLTIASGAVAGVLPAISGWRHAVRDRLAGTGTSQIARRPRAQAALVVIEVAAAHRGAVDQCFQHDRHRNDRPAAQARGPEQRGRIDVVRQP